MSPSTSPSVVQTLSASDFFSFFFCFLSLFVYIFVLSALVAHSSEKHLAFVAESEVVAALKLKI